VSSSIRTLCDQLSIRVQSSNRVSFMLRTGQNRITTAQWTATRWESLCSHIVLSEVHKCRADSTPVPTDHSIARVHLLRSFVFVSDDEFVSCSPRMCWIVDEVRSEENVRKIFYLDYPMVLDCWIGYENMITNSNSLYRHLHVCIVCLLRRLIFGIHRNIAFIAFTHAHNF
jgi:hypothetical protein